ncbi:MAG: dissimilatory sulfite reductase D family protein [bacterium]
MADEALRRKIMDFFKNSKKKKLYVKDVVKGMPEENSRDIKLAIQEMTTDGSLKYWSSGSTTFVVLPENFPTEV